MMLMVQFRPNEFVDKSTREYFLERMEENGGDCGDIEEYNCYAFFKSLFDVSFFQKKFHIPKHWLLVVDENNKEYELP